MVCTSLTGVYQWGVLYDVRSFRTIDIEFSTFLNLWAIEKSFVHSKYHYLEDFILAGHCASACKDTMSLQSVKN